MSRPDGETELRPPDAPPGDQVGSLRQDLAGEVPLLDVRPPHQLLERPPPGSLLGELDLPREEVGEPSARPPADPDPVACDSRLRYRRELPRGLASGQGACCPGPGLVPSDCHRPGRAAQEEACAAAAGRAADPGRHGVGFAFWPRRERRGRRSLDLARSAFRCSEPEV